MESVFRPLCRSLLWHLWLRKNVSDDAKALCPGKTASKVRCASHISTVNAVRSRIIPRIKNLLQMNPKDRYTAEQALNDASCIYNVVVRLL